MNKNILLLCSMVCGIGQVIQLAEHNIRTPRYSTRLGDVDTNWMVEDRNSRPVKTARPDANFIMPDEYAKKTRFPFARATCRAKCGPLALHLGNMLRIYDEWANNKACSYAQKNKKEAVQEYAEAICKVAYPKESLLGCTSVGDDPHVDAAVEKFCDNRKSNGLQKLELFFMGALLQRWKERDQRLKEERIKERIEAENKKWARRKRNRRNRGRRGRGRGRGGRNRGALNKPSETTTKHSYGPPATTVKVDAEAFPTLGEATREKRTRAQERRAREQEKADQRREQERLEAEKEWQAKMEREMREGAAHAERVSRCNKEKAAAAKKRALDWT